MVKKIILSLGVIGVYMLYALHLKQEELSHQITPPTLINPTPTPSSLDQSVIPPINPTPTHFVSGRYKDGSYTGEAVPFFYGNMQVRVVISGGKITDVVFLQYPNDRGTSIMINTQAMPYLKQEAILAQSGNVDIVSGATDSSMAFRQSLTSALSQATL